MQSFQVKNVGWRSLFSLTLIAVVRAVLCNLGMDWTAFAAAALLAASPRVPLAPLAESQQLDACPYVMGDGLHQLSIQPQPPKGHSFVDPIYKTTVTRITDTVADTGSKYWGTTVSYSTWNPLSNDGKRLVLQMLADPYSAPGYGLYDANTFKYLGFLDAIIGWNGQDGEPRWDRSGKHPTWIYYRKDMQIRYYDVVAKSDGLVHDFRRDFPAYRNGYYIYSGEKGSPSLDGRYWAYMVQQEAPPYNVKLMFVYDMVINRVVSSLTFPTGRFTSGSPHEVMMSPSGNYVYVAWYWNGTGDAYDSPRVYTRDLASNVKAFSGIPHANFAYSKQGHEGIIGLHTSCDVVRFTRLDTGEHWDLYPQVDLGLNVDHYWTFPGSSKIGWAFVSTGYQDNSTFWDSNAIFAFEVDETKLTYVPAGQPDDVCPGAPTPHPRIWRVASTQNIELSVDHPRNYYQQPNATMDYDGTRIFWASNWGKPTGRKEVYQLTLPPAWWQDLSHQFGQCGGQAAAPPLSPSALIPRLGLRLQQE